MTQYVKYLEQIGARDAHEKLESLIHLFLRWNSKINLSAARTQSEVEEHVLDSLHVMPHLMGTTRVLDVGSGGGFPVLIAAICAPAVHFVALEPTAKKQAFLKTAAREISLPNLEALAERIEDHSGFGYDVAMSRATFDLKDWLERGRTLVRSGGVVIGFEAIERGDLPTSVVRYRYEIADKPRSIVIVRVD